MCPHRPLPSATRRNTASERCLRAPRAAGRHDPVAHCTVRLHCLLAATRLPCTAAPLHCCRRPRPPSCPAHSGGPQTLQLGTLPLLGKAPEPHSGPGARAAPTHTALRRSSYPFGTPPKPAPCPPPSCAHSTDPHSSPNRMLSRQQAAARRDNRQLKKDSLTSGLTLTLRGARSYASSSSSDPA